MSDLPKNSPAARILICEDELFFAKDMALTLSDLGYEIAGSVVTGEEAIRAAEKVRPDLILMDINLAGEIDGIEAAEKIRAEFDIPLVYLTAYAEKDVYDRAMHTQPYGYLSKPVRVLELTSTVETALYKHEADRKVRESEARRAKAEDLAGLHSWEWEIRTGDVIWSAEFHRAFGFQPGDKEATFDTFINSVHAEDRGRVRSALRDALESGSPYDLEFRIVQPNGHERFLHSRGEIQGDAKGQPVRMRGMALDITDRKRAEEALRHSEERFRMVYESGMLGMGFCKPDGQVVDANDTYLAMIRRSRDDLINNRINWREITPPEHLPTDLNGLEELMAKGRCTPYEKEYLLPDGRRVPVIIGGALLPGSSSTVIAFALDITERKKAERQRDHILNMSYDLICVAGMDGFFKYVNPSWERVLGYTREDLLSRPFLDFIHPEDHAKNDEEVRKLKSGQATIDFENRYIHKDGSIKNINWTATPVPEKRIMYCIGRDVTDHKRAEEELQRQVSFMESLLEAIPAPVFYRNIDHIFLGCNHAFSIFMGRPKEKIIGKSVWDVYPAELADEYRRKDMELFEDSGIQVHEDVVQRSDGVLRRVIFHKASFADPDGRVAGLIGVMLDITEKQQAEEALRARERLLDKIYEILPVGLWVADKEGRLRRSNPVGRKIWGAEPLVGHEEFGAFKARRLPSGGEIAPYDWALARTVNEGITVSDELLEIDALDGEKRIILNYSAPVLDESGKVDAAIVVNLDVTKRMRAEERLRESEEKYRFLFDNSPLGIISVDTEGRILEVNKSLLDILGSPSKEATKAIHMFELSQLVESGVSDAFRSCMTTGERAVKEFPYVSKWGKQSHLRTVLTPIMDQEGTISGCQAVVEDITEQKKLEEQLRLAQRMEAIGTLAGGISHDFNNLLQIISGNAEFLEMELADKGMKFGAVDAIRQAAQRGTDLVKQILTFSRKIDTKFESINLNDDVVNAERFLYRTIPKMIEIQLKLEPKLKPVRADSSQIEQLLINLAVNAKDAMPEGGKLTIETRNVLLDEEYCRSHADLVPGQYVLLTVSDTGYGIDEEVLRHVFEPFFTTKGRAEGTGLGLATSFGIVKMHGAHITCQSRVGKGTTFEVYFPAAESEKEDVDKQEESQAVPGGTETILVVDDEGLIRELAKRILERSGYSVLTAAGGKEGIEIYAEHKSEISLVILDLIMPEMGGKQCLEELLKIDPQVKALIASGFAIEGNTRTFLESEAKGMVSKPFRVRELLLAVRDVLDGV